MTQSPARGALQLLSRICGMVAGFNKDVYSLLCCPSVPQGTRYLFIAIDENGRRPVGVGRAKHSTPSLNLASIRHTGASLGASEVHVYRPDRWLFALRHFV